jgi:hypothetical protein
MDALLATLKCHLRSGQEDTRELGDVFDVHVLLRTPLEFQALLLGHNGNDLQTFSGGSFFGQSRKGTGYSYHSP